MRWPTLVLTEDWLILDCDTVGRTDCFWNAGLRFVFAKCRGKQESPPTFILSNKEKEKKNRKNLFREFEYAG